VAHRYHRVRKGEIQTDGIGIKMRFGGNVGEKNLYVRGPKKKKVGKQREKTPGRGWEVLKSRDCGGKKS